MSERIVAIIQARMGSSRLPGKTLMPIVENKGALELMLERVARCTTLSQIVVATTVDSRDTPISDVCNRLGVPCFRGDEDDVLDRYYQAAIEHEADIVVRLTGDCPMQDPAVVDRLVSTFLASKLDYMANAMEPTYPDGFDAEVFTMDTLAHAWENATLLSEREHVTPFVHKHPELFSIQNLPYDRNVGHYRCTLDEPEDFELIQALFQALYDPQTPFTLEDVVAYLDQHPELHGINQTIKRNEGYEKSLTKDTQ